MSRQNKIKILSFLLLIIFCISLAFYDFFSLPSNLSKQTHNIKTYKTLIKTPEIGTLTTIDNKKILLEELQEELILVNFWASWCAPCIEELPSMLNLIKKHKGKIALLTISTDDKIEDIRKFRNKLKITGTEQNIYWVWDEGKNISLNIFNTLKVPETIIITKKPDSFSDTGKKELFIVKKVIGSMDWSQFNPHNLY